MPKHTFKNYWEENIFPTGPGPTNQTVYWRAPDSEENFRKKPTAGYTETSITYSYNSHGFRTKEFDRSSTKNRVFFIGCSFTEGIGLRSEDTWASKVESAFPEHDCYNLGFGGQSSDYCARVLYNLVTPLYPSIVFILWPPIARFETWHTIGVDDCAQMQHTAWSMTKEQSFLYDDANLYQNYMRNRALVLSLQKIHKFTLVEQTFDDLNGELSQMPPARDRARDSHWAPSINTYVANKFISQYHYITST